MKLTEIKWKNVQGSVYTWSLIFKLFLRLGLPSALIRHELKRSFSKTLFKPEAIRNAGFSFSCTQTKRWRHDNHLISLFESPNTNPKWLVILAFFNSSGVVWKENIWRVFSVTPPFLDSFSVYTRKLSPAWYVPRLTLAWPFNYMQNDSLPKKFILILPS